MSTSGHGLFYIVIASICLMSASQARCEASSDDGIVAVLTAPIDAAIDVAFAAIGYDEGDGDE